MLQAIPEGSQNFYMEQIFNQKRLPKLVLISFQNNDMNNGSYNESISLFEHCNVSSMTFGV
jgi:hypothetical protein